MSEHRKYKPSVFYQFDSQKYFFRLIRYWYLILLGLVLGLSIAWLNIRYTQRIYRTGAQIISKKWEESAKSPLSSVINQDLLVQTPDIYQEIALINSEKNVQDAINLLDLDVSYYLIGNVLITDCYPAKPIVLDYNSASTRVPYDIMILVSIDGDKFTLSSENESWNPILSGKSFAFGKQHTIGGFNFTLNKGEGTNGDDAYYFKINSTRKLIGDFRGRMQVSWFKEGSSLINLNFNGSVPERDRDFLETFIQVVIKNNINDKNLYATNTLFFINEQLTSITDTLTSFDSDIDMYKLENREFIKGSEYIFAELEQLNEAKIRIQLANRYFDYLEQYIQTKRDDRIFAPNLIGIEAPLLNQLVDSYIDLKLNVEVPVNEKNAANPLLTPMDTKKEQLEQTIYENLKNLRASNQDSLQNINNKIRFMMSSVGEYQSASRTVGRLERLFMLNDKIYNLLLEKKVEVSIAKASTTSDYEMVNKPSINYKPIAPDQQKSYTMGGVIGAGVPMAIIFLLMMLNRKIVSKDDVEDFTDIPIIGIIGRGNPERGVSFFENPKSPIAESFRGLRSNLNFYLSATESKSKVVLVTSSIGSEGKTYTSLNLAYYYALSGAKTILIGADLRKPTIHKLLELDASPGLSDYLVGKVSLNDSIQAIPNSSMDVLTSGIIPPNPSELLMGEAMEKLIQELKQQYDYILIDSPPFGLVSDTRELLKFTDMNLVLVRQSYTTKDALYTINEFKEESQLKQLAIVFNYVSFRKFSYGYGYGRGFGYRYGYGYLYGYGQPDKSKWWNFRNKS